MLIKKKKKNQRFLNFDKKKSNIFQIFFQKDITILFNLLCSISMSHWTFIKV